MLTVQVFPTLILTGSTLAFKQEFPHG